MCLDTQRVIDTYDDYSQRYAKLIDRFSAVTGGINPKSGKQMREFLYGKPVLEQYPYESQTDEEIAADAAYGLHFDEVQDYRGQPLRTKGGKPKTDKKVLPLLKAHTPAQKEFKHLAIEIAKLKVPVQNLKKMKAIIDRGESLVYATINQTVTDTHRLSSSGRRGGFQFHNFDRAFKPLFRCRNTQSVVVEADAPQLEFRVATHLGRDAVALQDIESGADIHAFTASILKTSRQDAKAHTFKPLYGGRSGTKAEKRYYAAFKERYNGIAKTQEGWTWEVAKTKELRIASGLKFYWPDAEISSGGYVANTPSIYNYPIQSFATADIIPLTLVLIWHHLDGMESFLVNTIHDSVVAEVPASELDSYTRIIVQCFTTTIYELLESLYGIKFSIPLGVEVKTSLRWADEEAPEFTKALYDPGTTNPAAKPCPDLIV